MSLHRIYHPPNGFSASEKQELARRITALYTTLGLPPFYVNVLFVPVEEDSLFVGGEQRPKFIRIVIEHMAAQLHSDEVQGKFMDQYERAIASAIKERGFEWQVHVQEIADDKWRLNGRRPPPPNSSTEQDWIRFKKIT